MGNNLTSKLRIMKSYSSVKVMMIDGTTFKLRPPSFARDALHGHPAGHVLMDSTDVKLYGLRAKPLQPDQPLKDNQLYFLVELPKPPHININVGASRVRSGIEMTAKDRLQSLKLSRRTVSDISEGGVRVKVRMPKAEVDRLIKEAGGDATQVATRIVEFCSREDIMKLREREPTRRCSTSLVKKEKRMRFASENEIIG